MYYIVHCTGTPLTCFYFFWFCFLFLQTGRKEKGDPLNSAIDKMTKKTRDLRRQVSPCPHRLKPTADENYVFKKNNTPLTTTFTKYFCYYYPYKKRNTNNIPVHLSAISKDQVTIMYFLSYIFGKCFSKSST